MVQRALPASGFTLLEMLLALAMIGVLATALYASLHLGFDARARAEASLAPARAAALALDMIGREVSSAVPPSGLLAGAFIGSDAIGETPVKDSDTLQFYALIFDQDRSGAGIRRIEFLLTPSEDGSDTVLVRQATANLLAPVTPEPVQEVLCRHVTSFNIRYFDGASWLEAWDSTAQGNALPLAVEIRLEVRDAKATENEGEGAQLTRVFPVPCGAVPSDAGQAQQQ
jgi:general secretion pathway protein J